MAKKCKKKSTTWKVSDKRAESLVPESGAIRDYFDYIRDCNDAPLWYHLGSIITAIITLIGHRDLKVIREDRRVNYVPLQIWSAIIGGTGDRKSAAMTPVCRIIRLTNNNRVLSKAASAEAWHQELARPEVVGVGLVHYEELSRLFDMKYKTFNAGMHGWLLDAWGGGPLTHRVVQEVDEVRPKYPPIQRVRLSLLGAIPPDILSEKTGGKDWQSGLLPRVTFWGAERKGFLELDGYNEATESKIADRLIETCNDDADIYINPRVAGIITEWCTNHVELCRHRYNDNALGILNRLRDKGFVIAAALAVSDLEVSAHTRLRVQPQHAEHACRILATLKRSTLNLFNQVSTDEIVRTETAVSDYITKHPGCTRLEISEFLGVSRQYVGKVIRILEDEDAVMSEISVTKGHGRRPKRYFPS